MAAPAHAPAPKRMRQPAPAPASSAPRRGVPVVVLVIAILLAAAAGFLVDRFVLGGGSAGTFAGRLTVAPSDLDSTIATYSYDGATVSLSAREVLEEQGLLEGATNADGSYDMPTADDALAVARSRILAGDAEKQGITASEQDVLAYAESTLGTRSLSDVALAYGTSEEAVRKQLEQSVLMERLRGTVVSAARPEAPQLPEAPAQGEEVALLPKYGAYIVALAGDEWDGEENAWASEEGAFARALASYPVSPEGASYDAALQAYWVAYQRYVEQDASVAAIWTDYVNGLLTKANISLSTLAI